MQRFNAVTTDGPEVGPVRPAHGRSYVNLCSPVLWQEHHEHGALVRMRVGPVQADGSSVPVNTGWVRQLVGEVLRHHPPGFGRQLGRRGTLCTSWPWSSQSVCTSQATLRA